MKKGVVMLPVVLGLGMSTAWAKVNLQSQERPSIAGEVIVKLRSGVSMEQFISGIKQKMAGDTPETRQLRTIAGNYAVVKSSNKSISNLKLQLESTGLVEYSEPNYIQKIIGVADGQAPNDPSFGQLWGLKNTGRNEPNGTGAGVVGADVDAMKAWEITRGSRNVKIAVIDTGIDYNHPDLVGNMWVNTAEANGRAGVDDDRNGFIDDVRGWDFANDDADPMDGHSHGTHCAGTIGAIHDNGVGVAGVMSEVTLVPVKFLTDGGSGSTADAVEAIDYATKVGVDIMSNSWGGGGFSQALKDSIQRASAAGIIFTAAAGNDSANNDTSPHYPSNYEVPNVISVAAHTAQDDLASFSCYGRRTVHIAAPGHRILSTVKNGGYAVYSGTSMATPHVSGVLGLLLAQEGRMTHASLKERMQATSNPIAAYRRRTISGGRINAFNLLTNTRPTRNEPNPSDWERVVLDTPFESTHPYVDNARLTRTLTVPGAKLMRARVARFDTESGYDFLKVLNGSRAAVDSVSGQGTAYETEYVEGDTMILEFTSDSSVQAWGFLINEIEVIR
jgi:thermitase